MTAFATEEIKTEKSADIAAGTLASGSCGEQATWTLSEDYVLTISGTGAIASYTDAADEKGWKDYSSQIKKIVIEEGITETGNDAFSDITNFEEVTIPSTMTYLAKKTFALTDTVKRLNISDIEAWCNMEVERAWWDSGCYPTSYSGVDVYLNGELLTELTIPSTIKTIPAYAFYHWKSVQKATLEYGVEIIGGSAFSSCVSLTEINIPESVTDVGYGTFISCTSLKELTIPNSVNVVSGCLFTNTTPIEKLTLPITYRATQLGQSMGGGLPRIKTFVFTPGTTGIGNDYNTAAVTSQYSYLNTAWRYLRTTALSIVLEEGITHIGNNMFRDCSEGGKGVTELTIPSTVTSIGTDAIASSVKLKVYEGTYGETFAKANGNKYERLHNFKEISRVESTCYSQGYVTKKCQAKGCGVTETEYLPLADHQFETVHTWDDGAEVGVCKYGCGEYSMGEELECTAAGPLTDTISWYVYGEKYLVINGHGYLESTNSSPWEDMDIEYCYIPEDILFIGANVFANTSLSAIAIPASVEEIDMTAFAGCENLETILLSEDNENYSVKGSILSDADGETILLFFGSEEEKVVPDEYTTIGADAFVSSKAGTRVVLPYTLGSFESVAAFADVEPVVYDNSYARRYLEANRIEWTSNGMYELPWSEEEVHYQMAYHMLVQYLKDQPSHQVSVYLDNISAETHTISMTYTNGRIKVQMVSVPNNVTKYQTYFYLDEEGLVNDLITMECLLNGTINNGYTATIEIGADEIVYNKTRLWTIEAGKYVSASSLNKASCIVLANQHLDTMLFNGGTNLLDLAGLYITDLGFKHFYANSEGTIHLNTEESGAVDAGCTTEGRSGDQTCTICGAFKQGEVVGATGHAFVNGSCTTCGEADPDYKPADTPAEELKISGASLTLQDNLTINYMVKEALFTKTGYENPYMVFVLNGKESVVEEYTKSGDNYVFAFKNIAPNQMNDMITATVHAEFNGEQYQSASRDYGVITYCNNMLNKSTDAQGELRTLLVDLLNYGAQSQIYTNYKTDNLVNASLTETQKSWATKEDREWKTVQDIAYKTIDNPSVAWKGAGLMLTDRVEIRLSIEADDITDLRVKAELGNGTEWFIESSEFKPAAQVRRYNIDFNGLNSGQMSESVYFTVYEGDKIVSNTVCYSVESYAYAQANKSAPDEALLALLKVMMKYGDAAYNYAN